VAGADLDTLQSLLEKSLLRFTPSETGGRYWLLETIHEYAAERLEEAEVLRRAHAEHFRRLVESARPALRGLGQTTWLDRLDVEHDNLRASLAWLLHTDPRLGAELASALTWFWQLRNHLGEGEGWLSLALSACEEPPTRAALVQGRGQLAYYRGEREQAEGLMREAAERWEYVGAQRLSESLVYLGVAAGDRGDPDEARTAGDRAVATAREVGDPWTLGLALWGLGANLVLERCPPNHANEAREVLTESVAILRGVGDPWALAASVFYLGSVELEAGNEATALELYEEAAALLREVGDKWRLAVVLSSIARLVEAGGDDERARRLDAEVEALEHHLGRLKANRFVD
jgi:tetratricopeptide (TPR) repeat protein